MKFSLRPTTGAAKLESHSGAAKARPTRIVQEASCDCPAHRHAHKEKDGARHGSWSLLLPLLACAICPACLATYAKLLSLVGVGVGMTESEHLFVLGTAVLVSVVVSGVRSWRSKRWWPIAFAVSGAALIVAGHLVEALHALEWAGVLVLMAGGLSEHFRLRAGASQAAVVS